jgi:ABC-2 type transport system permease protein
MSRIAMIAWREFTATVLTWSFALSVLMLPLLGGLMAILMPLVTSSAEGLFNDTMSGIVLVLDTDPALYDAMIKEAEGDSDYDEVALERVDMAEDIAIARINRDGVVAVIAHAETPMDHNSSGRVLFVSTEVELTNHRQLKWLVAQAEARIRLETAGLNATDARKLVKRYNPKTVPVDNGEVPGETSEMEHGIREAAALILPLMSLSLLWIGVFVSAQYLLQNTMEERSSKVMEVMLSAVSPMELMTGKIVGLGFVGGVMTAVYGGTLGVGLVFAAMTDLLHWSSLPLFVLFYIQAYLILGSMFAAIGSAVTELREAQSLMTPAVLLVTMPFLLLVPMIDEPNGAVAVTMSYFPMLTPFAMAFRVMSPEAVPPLQIVTTLIWGFMWAFGCLWASAKVFRIGVLMQGKAPTFTELGRWIFQD